MSAKGMPGAAVVLTMIAVLTSSSVASAERYRGRSIHEEHPWTCDDEGRDGVGLRGMFPHRARNDFKRIAVFGDSLSDSGNLQRLLGIPPPPYYEGRFADGPNYVDVLAEELGMELEPSEDGGTNFAFGRARTAAHPHEADGALSGLGQVEAYLDNEEASDRTLFVVFLGADNLRDGIGAVLLGLGDPQVVIPTAVGAAIADLAEILAALVQGGAQTIVVPNMPDLGRVPEITQLPPSVAPLAMVIATDATRAFNLALDQLLMTFDPAGIEIVRVDVFGLLEEVVRDPDRFDLENVDDPCFTGDDGGVPGAVCDDPDEYLFWDRIHPTAAAHELLAGEVLSSVFPEPPRCR